MKFKKILAGAMAGAMVLGSLTFTSASIPDPTEIADNLVAYYSFDSADGITLNGAATITANPDDSTDSVLLVDSTSGGANGNYATISGSVLSSADYSSGFSVSMNIRPTAQYNDWNYLFGIGTTAYTDSSWEILQGTTGFIAQAWGTDYYSAFYPNDGWTDDSANITDIAWNYFCAGDDGTCANADKWYNIVYVYGTESIDIYLNGVHIIQFELDETNAAAITTILSKLSSVAEISNFVIGCGIGDGQNFGGYIDDLAIYSDALTATDVAALYANDGYPYVTGLYADSDTIYMTVDQTKSAADYISLVPSTLSGVTCEVTSGTDVASVASDGTITGLANGTATITVTYSGSSTVTNKNVTLTVSVTDPKNMTGITLSSTEVSVVAGATSTVTVSPTPSDSTDDYTLTWTSSDEKVATVANGVISGVAAGTATIKVVCSDTTTGESFEASVSVTVTEPAVVATTETTSDSEDDADSTDTEATTEEETESEETVTTVEESETMEIESFWTTFTSGYEVTEDLLTLTFTTTSLGSNYYENAIWALYSSDSGYICVEGESSDSATEDSYVEYWVGRADYYGWGSTTSGTATTATYEVTSTPDDWDAWYAATQEGATVTVTAQLDGSGNAVITCACEGYEYTVTVPVDTDSTTYLALSGENCTLSDLTVNGESENFQILVEEAASSDDGSDDGSDDSTGESSETTDDGESSSTEASSSSGSSSATTVVKTVYLDDLTAEDFWTSFSDGLEISEGQKIILTGTTTNNGTDRWDNALFILYSSGDGTVTAEDYVEYFVGRMDNYGWGTATYEVTSEPADWDAWLAATQAGAEFTITATYLDGVIQIVCSCEGAEYVMTYTVEDTSKTYYIALTGEQCTLTDLVATYYEATDEDTTTTPSSSNNTSGSGDATPNTGDAAPIIPIAAALFGCAVVAVAMKKRTV